MLLFYFVINPDVLCPRPTRLHKRLLPENIDPEIVPLSKDQRLHSLSPLLTDDQPSKSPCITSAPPWVRCMSKRVFKDFESNCTPLNKNCQLLFSTDSLIDAWLSAVSSPSLHPSSDPSNCLKSCPATIDSCKHIPASLGTIKQMSQHQYTESKGPGSDTSQSSKPGTSHPLYRGSLYNNFVIMDYSGRKIPQQLKEYVSTDILKQRKSSQLGDDAVFKVIDTVEELADSTEGLTMKLMRTSMFPFECPGIAEGGNSLWGTTALPNNPEYDYNLSAPKPDAYLGYSNNQRSGWSYAQNNVINHPVARPYAQPARGPTFPSVVVEIKSESTGGTLHVAENQAAGSGSYSVNALLWLLKEAGLLDSYSVKDKIAFSFAMSHRQAILYIHWYSVEDRSFFMSYLKSYSAVEPEEIRACNNTVKNIIDHALGARRLMIGRALEALFPFPEHWKQSRPASGPLTPITSFSEDVRPVRIRGEGRSS